ncbi:hypothetical protein NDU88_004580 [Pleurodeles waltl]|uniref:Uncharacterized protein n=1 Tax=Pleurodeles waltl TaxID=8319 RepID=A0AAV7RHA1_PLEWA|nr:hypothetical protein NDU88_004580 [Pleurodeles waltl]
MSTPARLQAGLEYDPQCGSTGSSTRLCEPQARPRSRLLSRSRTARTVVPTSTGGWREKYAVGRSGRHPLVECCVVAGQPHPARLPRGVVKSVEPSTDTPSGLILPRLGLRAGRKCNNWCRFKVGGPRPHEPPGRRRDRGPGRSAARSQHAKRARHPDRRRGPQRG